MEAMGLGTIVLVLVVIWYLGSSINAVLAKAGRMAEREYNAFDREQAFRIAKSKEELKIKVEKYQSDNKSKMTDEELDKFLDV